MFKYINLTGNLKRRLFLHDLRESFLTKIRICELQEITQFNLILYMKETEG